MIAAPKSKKQKPKDRKSQNRKIEKIKIANFGPLRSFSRPHTGRSVAELLKHGKQIIINGKDYEQNPENKLTLTSLPGSHPALKPLPERRKGTPP